MKDQTTTHNQEIDDESLDVPLLPRLANYLDPNEVLPLDKDNLLRLTANHFVSARTMILGQTGKGKGNAGALLTEFLLEAGLPFTFVDLEGEGWSFKEICPHLLVVGRSAHADREYGPEQMGRLAELSVEQGFSVVLDLSGYSDEEIFALLLPYLQSLWIACDRIRTPYHLLLDEVHELVPEEGTTPVKSLLRRVAKRGRKRGLGIIGMSQETASVDKKFLRQTDIRILLSVSYDADLKIYHTLIPGISLEALKNTMPAFPPGTGYVIVNHEPHLVHLKRRRSFDPSETPKLGDRRLTPILHTIDQQTLDIIDQTLPSSQGSALERLDRATLIQLVRDMRQQGVAIRATHTSKEKDSDAIAILKKQLQSANEKVVEQQEIIQRQIEQLKHAKGSSTNRHDPALTQLPATMHITEAHIERADVHQINATPVDQIVVVESGQPEHKHGITSTAIVGLPVNDAKVKSLQKRLGQLEPSQYKVFKLLVEHAQPMTIEEIAAWLNVAVRTAHNHIPPQGLFTLGLIERSKRGHAYIYKAKLKEYLTKEFPGANIHELTTRVLN